MVCVSAFDVSLAEECTSIMVMVMIIMMLIVLITYDINNYFTNIIIFHHPDFSDLNSIKTLNNFGQWLFKFGP